MWLNYLKVIIRTISRNKFFSIINILGLSVGIAAFVLISIYVSYEFSYDKHFTDAKNIYRVTMDMQWEQAPTQEAAVAPGPTAYYLVDEYPEVIAGTRFTFLERSLIEYLPDDINKSKRFYESNIMTADSNLLKVLNLQIVYGDPNALTIPNALIISETAAKKYFGDSNPIGEILELDNTYKYVVKAVMKDIPENTHFHTDFIGSGIALPDFDVNNWLPLNLFSYIKFDENADISQFEEKLLDFRDRNYTNWKETTLFRIQPLLDIHLKNNRVFDFAITADHRQMIILSGIALLILIIACINFMNLSTARSIHRSKEVGIRKVVGSTREKLIIQFVGESIFVAIISTFLAVVLIESLLPDFREITNSAISIDYQKTIYLLIGLAILVGFFSGIYPAYFTSSFRPIEILKGKNDVGGKSTIVRKGLVVFQFVIMVLLLIGSSVIFLQMKFIKNKNLGFDKDQMVYTTIDLSADSLSAITLKNKLANYSNVESVSRSELMPGITPFGDHFMKEGSEEFFPMRTIDIDHDYIPSLGIKLLSGRNFSSEYGLDSSACIINESAATRFGWTAESALNKKMDWNFAGSWDNQIHGHIVGVVEDYHFKSLHEEVEAIVLTNFRPIKNVVAARIHPENIEETISFFEKSYREILPNHPFEYHFLDNDIDALYKMEKRFEKIIIYFVILAIFIACLGLMGLSTFVAEKKFKEIGIRKTFGASVAQIIIMFSKEFAIWVLIANIIGWPLGWYLLNNWLENFAYRTEIPFIIYPLVLLSTLVIAVGTVSFLAYKAALKNPVEAIRYE